MGEPLPSPAPVLWLPLSLRHRPGTLAADGGGGRRLTGSSSNHSGELHKIDASGCGVYQALSGPP